jgi:iron complex transport system substrate-binding protein
MIVRRIAVLFSCLFALQLLQAAIPFDADANTKYPYSCTDALNRKVTITREPARIVSLSPAITETIWMLGAGGAQVGRTDFCDYPPEVRKIKSIGGIINANIEAIALLKPDVVLAHQGVAIETVSQLEKLGVVVVTFDIPATLGEILDQIVGIGTILGRNDEAVEFVAKKTELLFKQATLAEQADGEKPRVFIGGHSSPYITAGRGTFIDDLITLAGGLNIASIAIGGGKMPTREYPELTAEQILLADPQAIVIVANLDTEGARETAFDHVSRDRVFKETSAAKRGNVFVIEEDTLLRPGPRIFDALVEVSIFIAGVER